MAHDVFISHASTNKAIADAACAALEQAGIRCWIAPRDIRPGSEWGTALIEGIKGSRVLLLILSGAANRSPQIIREVERAVHLGIPIIPVRVEDVMPEGALEFHLGTVHWLDAMTPPLEDHLARLVRTVHTIVAEPPSDQEDRTGSPAAGADETTPPVRRQPPEATGRSRTRSRAAKPAGGRASEQEFHMIDAPVGGLLISPSPDGSPFVRIGDRVEVGDLLYRIQSGPAVHDIETDVAGEIDDIFERPDTPVRPGTPLFSIRVAGFESTERGTGRAAPEESDKALRFLRIRWDALDPYREHVPEFEVKPLVRAGQTVKIGEPLARVTLGRYSNRVPIRAVVRSPVRGRVLVVSDGSSPAVDDDAPDRLPILFGIGFRRERTDLAPFAEIATTFEQESWQPLRNWSIATAVALFLLVVFVGSFAEDYFTGYLEPKEIFGLLFWVTVLAPLVWIGVRKIRAAWPRWVAARRHRSTAAAWDYGTEIREPAAGLGDRADPLPAAGGPGTPPEP